MIEIGPIQLYGFDDVSFLQFAIVAAISFIGAVAFGWQSGLPPES